MNPSPMDEEAEEAHTCRYRARLVWAGWTRNGPLAERLARRIPVCEVCGREQPARRPRQAVLREARAEAPEAPPLADELGRAVAGALMRRGGGEERSLPVPGLLSDLARRGVPASRAEEWIETFLRAGWLTVTWRLGRSVTMQAISLIRPLAFRELAWPGEETRRRTALEEAIAETASLRHPKAVEIAALLHSEEAGSFPPILLRALAALAVHAEAGDVLAERVFSARYLGGSKVLAGLHRRLERLVGSLAAIGVREGASVTLLGGEGRLGLAEGEIDLRLFAPFLGLSRETVDRLTAIVPPAGGLLAVENLAVFEACCRGEVEIARGALIAWSAGYSGPAFRRLVDLAAAAGAPVRIWTDLDLDGIRIARLIASWSIAGFTFYRMSPADLAAASRRLPLSQRSVAAILRDLAERPVAPLADTLRALVDAGSWVEQEMFLA